MEPFRGVEIVRVRAGSREAAIDRAATEEPLEIRLHGRPFAVIMRTPGADLELAAGFLLAERVIRTADDLGAIEHCRDESSAGAENVVNVTLDGAAAASLDAVLAGRRQIAVSASCGLCGRLAIDSLRVDVPPIESAWTVTRALLAELPHRLRDAQAVFDETGGLHAAGLFTRDGRLAASAEDVGRHNAVDKVIGKRLLADALPLSDSMLFVSGRTSYEIVQKAALAGVPILAAVSAPSSLAIDLARDTGITLAGFVRDGAFNLYSHPSRVE